MLDTQEFGDYLQSVGLRDFVGVPCSYLAPLINYAINSERFIISNNEGDAVAIASGVSLCRLLHNNSSLGHSACGDFSGNAADASLRRTSSASHSLTLHNPKNSLTILECQDSNDMESQAVSSPADSASLESQANSSNTDSKAEFTNQDSSNSKIVSEKTRQSHSFFSKCGHSGKSQGSLLNANNCKDFSQLPHLSPQAELPTYGVVLMQNSGLSNALSPLTSLNYTFKIPILGFVSLRGERDSSGKNTDEPQHELLGVITDTLLETCEIKYAFLDSDMDRAKMQVQEALEWLGRGESFFFIVKDKTFSKVALVSGHSACGNSSLGSHSGDFVDFRVSDTIANADSMSSSPLKSTKSLTSNTALVRSTSPYLQNTRIVDSAIAESQADSTPCHTEALAEVSSTESKRDISPFSKARTSKALAHTCKYDKILESQADSNSTKSKPANKMPTRLEALSVLHALAKDSKALLLATTGKCGRELYEIEDSPNQLYMVGSMGCVSSLSLGIALKSRQKVIAIDGDSALLMRLGALSTNAYYTRDRNNFCHILLDNESHDSTGGQFNLSPFVDFSSIARSCGYVNVYIAESLEEFESYVKAFLSAGHSVLSDKSAICKCGNTDFPSQSLECQSYSDTESLMDSHNADSKNLESKTNPSNLDSKKGAWFIYLKIQKGSKENLGRPKITPQEVAQRLSEYMQDNQTL